MYLLEISSFLISYRAPRVEANCSIMAHFQSNCRSFFHTLTIFFLYTLSIGCYVNAYPRIYGQPDINLIPRSFSNLDDGHGVCKPADVPYVILLALTKPLQCLMNIDDLMHTIDSMTIRQRNECPRTLLSARCLRLIYFSLAMKISAAPRRSLVQMYTMYIPENLHSKLTKCRVLAAQRRQASVTTVRRYLHFMQLINYELICLVLWYKWPIPE